METSFWQSLADNAPEERTGFAGEDLPPDAWVAVDTATTENGRAAPEIQLIEGKGANEGKSWLKFKVGLIAVGGDAKLNAELHARRMAWFETFLLPGEKELQHNPGQMLAGRFTGFANALYAPGVAEAEKDQKARSKARWGKTIAELGKVAQASGLSVEQYNGQTPNFLGALVAKGIETAAKRLLIKTKHEKGIDGVMRLRVQAFEDFTPENVKNRKVVMFPTNGTTPF